jgi:hypothetical protein
MSARSHPQIWKMQNGRSGDAKAQHASGYDRVFAVELRAIANHDG